MSAVYPLHLERELAGDGCIALILQNLVYLQTGSPTRRMTYDDPCKIRPIQPTIRRYTVAHSPIEGGPDVAEHKFQIGEQVEFIPGLSERLASAGVYEVVRQLPTSNGEFGYRIKSEREPYERVVRESQLRQP